MALFARDAPKGEPTAVETGDPKRALLLAHHFIWEQSAEIWLNEGQRKMISRRAVRDMSLAELRAFVELPQQANWLNILTV